MAFIRQELEDENLPLDRRRSRLEHHLSEDGKPQHIGLHERDGAVLRVRDCQGRRPGSNQCQHAESRAEARTPSLPQASRVLCPDRTRWRIKGATRQDPRQTNLQRCRLMLDDPDEFVCPIGRTFAALQLRVATTLGQAGPAVGSTPYWRQAERPLLSVPAATTKPRPRRPRRSWQRRPDRSGLSGTIPWLWR